MTGDLRLREATMEDAALLLEWRNDPQTRAHSFQTSTVELDDHLDWLEARLADRPGCRIWIAELDGAAAGQVRIDRIGDDVGEISVSVDPAVRGKGVGVGVIDAATSLAFEQLGLARVEAHIKRENHASLAAFRRAGYVDEAVASDAWVLSRRR